MVQTLSASPPFADCSGMATPRSLLLTSSDPDCRVAILASPDGTTRGATILRVLTPASVEVIWDANDFLTFTVTAGRDASPVVAVSGPAAGSGSSLEQAPGTSTLSNSLS
jgi:hypothetical protein